MQYARLGDYVNIKTGKLDANAAVENGKKYDSACKGYISNEDKYKIFCCVLNINDSPNTS